MLLDQMAWWFVTCLLFTERYSEWGFVDTELLQRDHGSQRDRESGQRATIPTRQDPPLLQQRDRALDRRAGLTVRPVVDLRKRWQLATGRLAQGRVDPAAKKAKIAQHVPAGQHPVQPRLGKRPGIVHRAAGGLAGIQQPAPPV